MASEIENSGSTWPQNMWEDVIGRKEKYHQFPKEDLIVFDDDSFMEWGTLNTLWAMYLAKLNERETRVLVMRYMGLMTLENIANVYGTGIERIRQIEAKALHRLRKMPKTIRGRSMVDVIDDLVDEKARELAKDWSYKLAEQTIKEKLEEINAQRAEMLLPPIEAPASKPECKPIEDLDLSVRAWNCLNRTGIDNTALLTNLLTGDDAAERLMTIRNMGRKSVEEILNASVAHALISKERATEIWHKINGNKAVNE